MTKPREFEHLEEIFRAGLARVDPLGMMTSRLTLSGSLLAVDLGEGFFEVDLDDYDRILVLGAGKATAAMAQGLERVLGERISGGLISVKYGHTAPLSRIETIEAGHPLPDDQSILAGRRIAELGRSADEGTLVISLISGGGSALLALPLEWPGGALSLADKQAVTGALLACGATIQEINSIRKHLSGLKGGRLARLLQPARSLNFILSDVVGDRLDVIASGITVGDPSTYGQGLAILSRYGLEGKVPPAVLEVFRKGAAGEVEETPKPGDEAFDRVGNILLGTNLQALRAAAARAGELGYQTHLLTSQATGEARELARLLLGIGKDVRRNGLLARRPACIIAGGETTVTLRGEGKGGRNQELALAFLAGLREDPSGGEGIYLLSASTDGNDGPTDAAGAFAAAEQLAGMEFLGLDPDEYLRRNDSYHFFDRLGGLLRTGPTNTNVCDLQILLIP